MSGFYPPELPAHVDQITSDCRADANVRAELTTNGSYQGTAIPTGTIAQVLARLRDGDPDPRDWRERWPEEVARRDAIKRSNRRPSGTIAGLARVLAASAPPFSRPALWATDGKGNPEPITAREIASAISIGYGNSRDEIKHGRYAGEPVDAELLEAVAAILKGTR